MRGFAAQVVDYFYPSELALVTAIVRPRRATILILCAPNRATLAWSICWSALLRVTVDTTAIAREKEGPAARLAAEAAADEIRSAITALQSCRVL